MAPWPMLILVDGECPLCRREANFLTRLDKGRGRLRFEDITDPAFDAAKYGTTFDAVMGQIHAVLPDGRVIRGLEVFRHAYAAVGWGWALAPTAWPIIKPIADLAYRLFARIRPRLPGRGKPCDNGRCHV